MVLRSLAREKSRRWARSRNSFSFRSTQKSSTVSRKEKLKGRPEPSWSIISGENKLQMRMYSTPSRSARKATWFCMAAP